MLDTRRSQLSRDRSVKTLLLILHSETTHINDIDFNKSMLTELTQRVSIIT